ncbi:GmrSD restriction endonuclease domain-containing protein [Streptomyces sp. NPDC054838]
MGRQAGLRGAAVAVALLLGLSGCGRSGGSAGGGPPAGGDAKPAAGDVLPGMVSAAVARTQLAALVVGKPATMAGYSRDKFTHWAEQGNKCDTREVVLRRDGKNVTQDAECRAVSGTWKSLYDGADISDAAKLDIDHMVPLAEGWRSGAAAWDAAKRKSFANDLTRPQLLAVSAASNRSKGDQSPDLWQPPDKASWCQYGRAWTTVKSHYGLTVTPPEKAMLSTMIDTCAS